MTPPSPTPLRTVLVGCGGISSTWLKAVRELGDVELAGLVDREPGRAEAFRDAHGLDGARTGTNLGDMLEALRPEAVFDCTVPAAHREVTLTALSHGCHVLGEKPLAPTLAEAEEITAAAERAERVYAVIQNRRYQNAIVRFREFLRSGAIGRPRSLHVDFFLGPHFGGFREEMPHVLLLDMAIHTFDQARFLSGADPVSVIAHDWNPEGSWYADGASAAACFEMTGGIVFTYRGSWCAEGRNTSWEGAWRVVGTQGAATWDGAEGFRAEAVAGEEGFLRPVREVDIPSLSPLTHTGHAGVMRDFVDAVRSGGRPPTHCADNLESLRMVHEAIRSAETGRRRRMD